MMDKIPDALQELLSKEPVRAGTSKRSSVRQTMDANAEVFLKLAELGHTSSSVAQAFMASYPSIRSDRADLTDDAYTKHVMSTYDSFKRKLRGQGLLGRGKSARKAARSRSPGKLRKEADKQAIQSVPVDHSVDLDVAIETLIEVQADTEGESHLDDFIEIKPSPAKPAVVKPTSGGYPIPKAKDF